MPRTLPWLKEQDTSSKNSRGHTHNGSAKRLGRDEDGQDRSKRPKTVARLSRTPSTSPPPAPPDVDFMHDHDDDWIMVEDEFLSVAQTFPRHLHHAEYQRIKKQNKQKTQDTLNSIKRPTKDDTAAPTASSKADEIQKKRSSIDKSVKIALEHGHARTTVAPDEDSSDNDELAINDRNLAGLMFGEESKTNRQNVSAAQGGHAKSKTRAAAGRSSNALAKATEKSPSPPRLESHHTSDRRIASVVEKASPWGASDHDKTLGKASAFPDGGLNSRHAGHPSGQPLSPNTFQGTSNQGRGEASKQVKDDKKVAAASEQLLDMPTTASSKPKSLLGGRLKARQMQREREQKQQEATLKSEKSDDNEIPLWLV